MESQIILNGVWGVEYGSISSDDQDEAIQGL